jgi:hypothetical protein
LCLRDERCHKEGEKEEEEANDARMLHGPPPDGRMLRRRLRRVNRESGILLDLHFLDRPLLGTISPAISPLHRPSERLTRNWLNNVFIETGIECAATILRLPIPRHGNQEHVPGLVIRAHGRRQLISV